MINQDSGNAGSARNPTPGPSPVGRGDVGVRSEISLANRGFQFVKEKAGINFGVYLLLVDRYLPPGPATVIAYSSSVILNFFMQRYFVFELRRSVRSAFALSMLVSGGGLVLDWLKAGGDGHRFFLQFLRQAAGVRRGAAAGAGRNFKERCSGRFPPLQQR